MLKWFAEHPTAANLLMAAIILLGLTSLPQLQRETFPRRRRRDARETPPRRWDGGVPLRGAFLFREFRSGHKAGPGFFPLIGVY